ncbi:MAG: VWA domain-containing protein [Mogibacterium sp.]|nr:VWA domain-containing protein [Mogibacterium sp.]
MDFSRQEKQLKKQTLSAMALRMAEDKIVANMRFLDPAVYALRLRAETGPDAAGRGLRTNGTELIYTPDDVLRRVRDGLTRLTHDYMHVLLHCIFRHYFVRGTVRKRYWNLAADIAAEEVIESFRMEALETATSARIREELILLRRNIGQLTAERIYRYLLDSRLPEKRLLALQELFYVDDHALWYESGLPLVLDEGEDGEAADQASDETGDPSADAGEPDDAGEDEDGSVGSELDTEQDWEKIAEMVKAAIEAGEGAGESDSGKLADQLRRLGDDTVDYSTFLRKFATRREALKVDDGSFDYIFYTYGLELYGDMPLVEPLEYRDDRQVRDLVIVIDSSASTEGELVESFVRQTMDVLMTAEDFQRRFNVRLLQCDAAVQEDVQLRTRADAEAYLSRIRIKGHGGTDFRPAFRYVDELLAQGAFTDLKGLIYFTDGNGTFPQHKPKYEAAFVFADDESAARCKVPPWAMKAVL